tara:strand:- start:248 stop:388 length:141 start_codon:yes stop_codon:yes gene_type:complete
MRLPLPDFSVYGIFEYLLFGTGIALGMALFTDPMSKVQDLIAGLKS